MTRTAWLFFGWLGFSYCLAAQTAAPALAFDALHKQVIARAGQSNVVVGFTVTNASAAAITIRDVALSCGCSVATMPAKPWTLKPGEQGQVTVMTDVRGKRGSLLKTAIVYASSGTRVLTYQVDIQEPSTPEERVRNQALAKTDRQAVFRGECAKCHAEPAKGKLRQELFAVACGICHEAEHRASMVPDLKALKKPTSREYWFRWIAHGKADTLMPAFGQKAGGPLTEGQIESLVEFLAAGGSQPVIRQKP